MGLQAVRNGLHCWHEVRDHGSARLEKLVVWNFSRSARLEYSSLHRDLSHARHTATIGGATMSASTSVATLESDPARAPRRVRHEPRRRELEVRRVDKISAHMIRITLGGDLEGFTSLGFDDH